MPGLLQTPQAPPQPAGGGMIPQVQASAPRMKPADAMAMFAGAGEQLIRQDRELFKDIKQRTRAVHLQYEQMAKLIQIAGAMGQDASALAPIMETLDKERKKLMREIVGRANVPTSASKPSRPKLDMPQLK